MSEFFGPASSSPYMLRFRNVLSDQIPAVTHVDRSARPQSVNPHQNRSVYELLKEFDELSGVPVLCNTSLNFNGRGFVNRLTDLARLAIQQGMEAFVFQDGYFVAQSSERPS
jgi:predicted NodU family carbamoyl transferase